MASFICGMPLLTTAYMRVTTMRNNHRTTKVTLKIIVPMTLGHSVNAIVSINTM